jgi:hypothetical protein
LRQDGWTVNRKRVRRWIGHGADLHAQTRPRRNSCTEMEDPFPEVGYPLPSTQVRSVAACRQTRRSPASTTPAASTS